MESEVLFVVKELIDGEIECVEKVEMNGSTRQPTRKQSQTSSNHRLHLSEQDYIETLSCQTTAG
jgi:hypothetical protein